MSKQTKKSQKSTARPRTQSKKPQLVDLDTVDLIEPIEKTAPSGRLHTLNVRFPWLKVILLILLVGVVVLGVEELLRRNASQPVGPIEVETTEETTMNNEDQPAADEEQLAPTQTAPAQVAPVQSAPTPTSTTQQPSTGRKLVALTFDDGPSAAQTPRLLQILREKKVKATFFVIGNMAQRSPNLLRQEEAEGHEVASHTMTHANFAHSTVEGIKWEVAAMNNLFNDVLEHAPNLTRPPYGNITPETRIYVNQPLILWTVDPEDWRYRNTATVRQNVVRATFDGAIILLHDIYATTVDAVSGIIDDLRAQGYEFMTVSELAAARGVVLQKGWDYGSFRP